MAGAVIDAGAKLLHLFTDPVHRLVARRLVQCGWPGLRCSLRGRLGRPQGFRRPVARISVTGIGLTGVRMAGVNGSSARIGCGMLLQGRVMGRIRLERRMLRMLRMTGVARVWRLRLHVRSPELMRGDRMLLHGCVPSCRIVRGRMPGIIWLCGIVLRGLVGLLRFMGGLVRGGRLRISPWRVALCCVALCGVALWSVSGMRRILLRMGRVTLLMRNWMAGRLLHRGLMDRHLMSFNAGPVALVRAGRITIGRRFRSLVVRRQPVSRSLGVRGHNGIDRGRLRCRISGVG